MNLSTSPVLLPAQKHYLLGEVLMRKMDWNAFQEAHFRPHLVVATLEEPAATASADIVALFERLATALGVSGNYAIENDGTSVRAAFEIDMDAERFASLLQVKTSARDLEWASRTVGRIDGVAQKRIAAALRRLRLKRPKRQLPSSH